MNQRVMVPPQVRVFERSGMFLYFDPHNFHWIQINESGRYIMERLRRFRTLDQISEEISSAFGLARSAAVTAVEGFVETLTAEGFLYSGAYKERDRAVGRERKFAHDVYLHMTNDCNLKCPYCYNKSDRDQKTILEKKGMFAPVLNTEECKRLVRRLIECGVRRILFTGGEPLMRADLFEVVAFARHQSDSVKLEVLTNAILIKGDVAKRLCELLDFVTISLDGHERHLHEHSRGKNTFAPTLRGLRNLIHTREQSGSKRPRVTIVPALTARNVGFMEEIYRFVFDDLKADTISPILFQAGDHQSLSLAEVPTFEDWRAAFESTERYMKGREPSAEKGTPRARPVIPRNHCGVGNGEFSIDPSGYVYPCQSLHFDEFICGNVRDADVEEIFLESIVMKNMRSTVVDRLDVCRHCDLKELCNGGCRATAYNVYREFDAHNEVYCRFLEEMAVDRLWRSCEKPGGGAHA